MHDWFAYNTSMQVCPLIIPHIDSANQKVCSQLVHCYAMQELRMLCLVMYNVNHCSCYDNEVLNCKPSALVHTQHDSTCPLIL